MTISTIDAGTALVLIDLQRGIVAGDAEPYPAADVVARSIRLAAAFRERHMPVVLVRVTAPTSAPVRRRTERTIVAPRAEGWDQFVPGLQQPGDLEVVKHQWSAFTAPELDAQLKRLGSTQIVLAGIATSIGVEGTARGAAEHGYQLTVAIDAVADRAQDAHWHSVTRIFPRLGETGTTEEIIALLPKLG